MGFPDPDMRTYGGHERRGEVIRTYRLAKWWKRWGFGAEAIYRMGHVQPNPCGVTMGRWVFMGSDGYWERLGVYRGRAWPRFWLAKVEVTA